MKKQLKACLISIIFSVFCMFGAFAQSEQNQAYKLYSKGQYAKAIQHCKEVLGSDDKNMDYYIVLCQSLVANHQYREAEYWATQALEQNRYEHHIIESLAEARFFLGNNNSALSLFQEYISLVGVNASRIGNAYYYMGEIYIRKAAYNHADIALTAAIRYEPLNDQWWVRLGYAREMAKNYSESAKAYENALKINPSQIDAQRGKDEFYVFYGKDTILNF